jgi:hypothetical protein
MKKKSGGKIKKLSPALPTKSNVVDKFPSSVQELEGKTPSEILKITGELLAPENSVGAKLLEGVYSGIAGTNFKGPDWVKRASRYLFKILGCELLLNPMEDVDLIQLQEVLGKLTGGLEELMKKPASPRLWMNENEKEALAPIIKELKYHASESSPKESKAFFDGRGNAAITHETLAQPTLRAKIILVLIARWIEIEELKKTGKLRSTGNLHTWLLTKKDWAGEIIIPAGVDQRQTRKLCKEIKLEFENQWRKSKPKI